MSYGCAAVCQAFGNTIVRRHVLVHILSGEQTHTPLPKYQWLWKWNRIFFFIGFGQFNMEIAVIWQCLFQSIDLIYHTYFFSTFIFGSVAKKEWIYVEMNGCVCTKRINFIRSAQKNIYRLHCPFSHIYFNSHAHERWADCKCRPFWKFDWNLISRMSRMFETYSTETRVLIKK